MKVLDLFITLVKIPSPKFQTGNVQAFLRAFVADLFPAATIEVDNAGVALAGEKFEVGNMLISIPATEGLEHLPVLGVEAHVDTVPEEKPIMPMIQEDGVVTSDGTTILGGDDKAGVAAICKALQFLSRNTHGPIQVIFSVGEESSMYGMRAFGLWDKIQAKEILCIDGFEPNRVFNACAGKIKYRATFNGQSAHGAEPEKAINALYMASMAVTDCVTSGLVNRMENGVIHNIAEVQSHEGAAQYPNNNTIPGCVTIAGELRGLDRKRLEDSFQAISLTMTQAAKELGGDVEFNILVPYQPFSIDSESGIIKNLLNKNPKYEFLLDSCDGSTHSNIWNEHGIESVVIGAGDRNPHTHEEYVVISELEECVDIIFNYLKG